MGGHGEGLEAERAQPLPRDQGTRALSMEGLRRSREAVQTGADETASAEGLGGAAGQPPRVPADAVGGRDSSALSAKEAPAHILSRMEGRLSISRLGFSSHKETGEGGTSSFRFKIIGRLASLSGFEQISQSAIDTFCRVVKAIATSSSVEEPLCLPKSMPSATHAKLLQ